ncbi:3-oxoacyl-[acyl-carrier-protein] synthase [Tulasnella sp. 427]|nr:3-oxoacyl-[acyl-carrier-protein] synthase [Tulasnella sp. 427]
MQQKEGTNDGEDATAANGLCRYSDETATAEPGPATNLEFPADTPIANGTSARATCKKTRSGILVFHTETARTSLSNPLPSQSRFATRSSAQRWRRRLGSPIPPPHAIDFGPDWLAGTPVAFKTGSVHGVRQVVGIAAANPTFPIIYQRTGDRAGGRHPYEDFDLPILAPIAPFASNPADSGFGGSGDVPPYICGDWALAYGLQRESFDGGLFTSYIAVAAKAHTSPSIRGLIYTAPGADDRKWEGPASRKPEASSPSARS